MVAVGVISSRKVIRRAICSLLLTLPLEEELFILFDVDTLANASEQMISSKPQVLLIDCDNSVEGCLNSIDRVREISPSTRCLLISENMGEEFEVRAARSGAWGLVTIRSDPGLLQQALRRIGRGKCGFQTEHWERQSKLWSRINLRIIPPPKN